MRGLTMQALQGRMEELATARGTATLPPWASASTPPNSRCSPACMPCTGSLSCPAARRSAYAKRTHGMQGNSANLGGALYADTLCNMTVEGVQFDGNLARQYGGAILVGSQATLDLSLSTFTGNGNSPCFAPPLVSGADAGAFRCPLLIAIQLAAPVCVRLAERSRLHAPSGLHWRMQALHVAT